MGHDEVRHELRELVGGGLLVLVDVQDHMGRLEPADALQVDRLRAADFRDRANGVCRMNAESGTPDQLRC